MEAAALGLRVDGVDGIDRASSSLDRLNKSAKGAENASGQLDRASKSSSRSISDVSRESDRASRSMATLSAAIRPVAAGLAAAFSVRALTQYADSWSDMTSLVRVNIGAHEDAAEVMGRLADIARSTYSSLELTASGFAQNAFTLNALGKSTKQQLDYTSALNNALVVSGAKGQQAQMVQDSLNRAMAEGSLRGQELQNVLNYGSTVATLLAEELGVNVKQLRDVAKEGRITGEVIFNALVKNMEQLEQTAESMPATIGDAFLLIRNSVLQAVGVYDQANGLSESFAERLVKIADAIRDTDWGPYIRALTTGAKIAAAYVAAIYAIPVAKAAAAAATAGYQAVLAAFSAQAAVTTAQLWSMNTALGVVGAAFAGFQIGTYLRNEFEIVEKAGIALMGGLHTMAVQVAGFFRVMGENIKFAVLNPLDAIRGAIADMLEWVSGLGRDALNFLGFEGLAAGVKTEFAGIRGATAAEHKATLEQIRTDTAAEAAMVSSIYAEMFADVGKNAEEAASSTEELSNTTNNLTNNVENLAAAQNALKQAFEQTLSGYHRQLTLAEDASEVEQLLYEIEHGRLQGLLPAQQKMLRGMAEELDMRNKLAQIESDQQEINRDRDAIARELMSEEERIQESYARRRAIIENATFENEQARTELLLRLENERNEALIEANGSYWDRWLLAAEENLSSFDELSKTVVDSFTQQFGNAFEDMIFNAESVGDAVQGMAQGMVRAVVNAIGQMIAQELAYQAILALRGQVATAAAATEVAAIGTTTAAATAATATTTTAQVAAATTTAAAWTPAAFMASIGSFGAAAAIGIAAVLALGALGGFRKGGYTGNGGVDDVAGVVHGKEFVFDAAATSRIGVNNLEAMRKGQALPTNVIPFPTASQGGAPLPPIVEVHNYGNNAVSVETEQNAQGQDIIRVVVNDILTGGEIADSVNRITGTQFQGS